MSKLLLTTLGGLVMMAGVVVVLPEWRVVSYDSTALKNDSKGNAQFADEVEAQQNQEKDSREIIPHQPLPEPVKAIYMTSCVAGTPSFREKLVKLIAETEINSVVIDVKDYSGTLSFAPESEAWQSAWANARCGARDMKEFVATLHTKGVFVIARVTVFQDPFYTSKHGELAVKKSDGVSVWKDYKGLSFIDVGAREYWDHLILLVRDTYNIGFDEINFDYVRYPSDGPMNDISFTHSKEYPGDDKMQANLEEFFRYLNEKLDDEELFAKYRHEGHGREASVPWTSVDLFGMTTTNYDDLSIGQVQDRAAPYFDFVAPMVYPSHYPKSFLGLGNPNHYPYKVVYFAMKSGVDRMLSSTTPMQGFQHTRLGTSASTSSPQATPAMYTKPAYTGDKFRTWIQDFDYGGDYDVEEVKAEIKASVDAGVNSWMIWAPSNIYTRGALEPSI